MKSSEFLNQDEVKVKLSQVTKFGEGVLPIAYDGKGITFNDLEQIKIIKDYLEENKVNKVKKIKKELEVEETLRFKEEVKEIKEVKEEIKEEIKEVKANNEEVD